MMPHIILASSSPYRQQLLSRLNLPFESISPNIDETPSLNESAKDLVSRLALKKAKTLLKDNSDTLIIGSDQVADLEGEVLTKPGTAERAQAQLKLCSGKTVRFYTGLALLDGRNSSHQLDVCSFDVSFRKLTDSQIHNYIAYEQPLNCAGSFKMEGLGITLFEKLSGDDPNTLIGLPLIRLTDMLLAVGIDPLSQDNVNK